MFAAINFVNALINFYMGLILIWCVMTFFRIHSEGLVSDIFAALSMLVVPYINAFRKFIPPIAGFDFSPVIAILVLQAIQRLLLRF